MTTPSQLASRCSGAIAAVWLRLQTYDAHQRAAALLAGAAAMAASLLVLSHNVVDQDLWHAMSLARESIRQHGLLSSDPFAYTPTLPHFIQHEWGSGLLAYVAATAFGGAGVLALKYLLGAGIILFCALRIRHDAPPLPLLIVTVPIAMIMVQPGFGTLRAQIYSFFFCTVLLWALDRDRDGDRRWLWWWPPLFVLWLNLHGGFIVAFGIIAAEWLERLLTHQPHRHLLLLTLGLAAAVAINPYGLNYYSYMAQAITMPRPHIGEWQPLWVAWSSFPSSVAAVLLSVALLGYALAGGRWRHARGIAVLLLLLVGTVRTNRLMFFYGFAWLMIVPGLLSLTPIGRALRASWKYFAALTLPAFAVVALAAANAVVARCPDGLLVPGKHLARYGDHVVYPVGAVTYLEANHFHGNLMVYFPVGSYVTWRLYPAVKVSMDSRYETAYPAWLAEENLELYRSAKDWQRVLAAYPTDLVLTSRRSALYAKLHSSPAWKTVYEDDIYILAAPPQSRLPYQDRRGTSLAGVFP